MLTAEEKEDLRKVALNVLASRHPTAWPVPGIRRRCETELAFTVTNEDVTAALELLQGLGFVAHETESLGSTKYWHATAEGVLHIEREN
jgi:hypothetical protein